jgi:hypothetical protein
VAVAVIAQEHRGHARPRPAESFGDVRRHHLAQGRDIPEQASLIHGPRVGEKVFAYVLRPGSAGVNKVKAFPKLVGIGSQLSSDRLDPEIVAGIVEGVGTLWVELLRQR